MSDRSRSGRQSFFWTLSRILFTVVLTTVFVHSFLVWQVERAFIARVSQATSWDIAEEYAADLEPLLSPRIKLKELERETQRLMRRNPAAPVFILDGNGKVVYAPSGKNRSYIDLKPVRRFLSVSGYPLLPIYGDNPENPQPGKSVPFSAAPVRVEGKEGFVYLSLRGEFSETVYHTFGDFTLAATAAVSIILLAVFASGFGLVAIHFLTRRFRALTKAIERFSSGDYSTRVPIGRKDEIGLHAEAFNSMAETIQKNIAALKENDHLRRELLANISHDIRSPLGAMLTLLEGLQTKFERMKDNDRRLYLDRALSNCLKLKTLVDDLFELSKLNARVDKPELTPVCLSTLLQAVASRLNDEAQARQVSIAVELPQVLPRVMSDEKMLDRAAANLVENAIRYSGRGSCIKLAGRLISEKEIEVTVSDSGAGIAPEELEHIFERFYRGKKAGDSEGSGLGLAITKRIIELHGSRIEASSEIGKGTTFRFRLTAAGAGN